MVALLLPSVKTIGGLPVVWGVPDAREAAWLPIVLARTARWPAGPTGFSQSRVANQALRECRVHSKQCSPTKPAWLCR